MPRKRKRPGGSSLEKGISKCSDSSRDIIMLRHIFPEEIWLLIFEVLSNVKGSLQNVSNASPYFRNILMEKRVHFLFPNVWEILANQYKTKYRTGSAFNEDVSGNRKRPEKLTIIFCKWCGSTRLRNWFSGILNLRLVCKSWSNGFDNFLQEPCPHKIYVGLESIGVQDFRQEAPEQVVRFLEHFGNTHINSSTNRSPFLGRSIYLKFGQHPGELEDQFLLGIQSILKKYGKYVLNFEFRTDCLYESDFYMKIKRILKPMTNLQRLTFVHNSTTTTNNYNLGPHMQTFLDETIIRNPIEPFNHIEYLKVRNLHPRIFNEVIRRSRNVSKLDGPIHEGYDIYSVQLSNLKDLSIKFESRAGLERLSGSHWPLEKLTLEFERKCFMEWAQVFIIIQEKWENSLTDLTLTLPKAKTMEDKNKMAKESYAFRLKLNSVKRLKLTVFNFASLDFILALKNSLEYLSVNLQWSSEQNCSQALATTLIQEQKIHFLNFFERPLESNIWSIFPNLKTFEFSSSFGLRRNSKKINWSYSRREWKKYISRK